MDNQRVREMRAAHRILAETSFDRKDLSGGYADRWLRVDLSKNRIEIRPVTQQMKELFVGGKGFDLWLTLQEIGRETRWDSPENPICFSSGPLGGTMSFPGSGKTLVTAISPSTHSMMDCNVGGFFGPYLKFAGFDALMLTGKATEQVVVVLDAVRRRVAIETAPLESVDSHLVAEELTKMYSDDEIDRRNVSVVSAGRAAEYTRLGVLNFSFYDWRRQVPRLKQAGRGGVGTVFRNKRVKALVIKNRGITPGWRITGSEPQRRVDGRLRAGQACSAQVVADAVKEQGGDRGRTVAMLDGVYGAVGNIGPATLLQIGAATGVPERDLFHAATFYSGFGAGQEPGQPGSGAVQEMAAFAVAQLFGAGGLSVPRRQSFGRFLAPGALRLVERVMEEKGGEPTPQDVYAALGGKGEVDLAALFSDRCPATLVGKLAARSCGACAPCREGLNACFGLLGQPITVETGEVVKDVTDLMVAACQCNYGRSAARALAAVLPGPQDAACGGNGTLQEEVK
ncbi:MAG: hypothetical protein FJ109_10440 [Deltaproteobacteria bacterium]|nr:hypothetical protein [Deltaproteobacteria bacterium]